MKWYFVFFSFLFCFFLNAQSSGNIELSWTAKPLRYDETRIVAIPNFQREGLVFNFEENSLLFSKKIAENTFSEEESLICYDLITEEVEESMLGVLDRNKINENVNFKIKNVVFRDESSVVLSFNPIYKEGNVYKKVISFAYTFKEGITRKLLARSSLVNLQNSVLQSGLWKKFYIEKSGVYKITKSFLSRLGVDVKGDPRNLKIYGNGGAMIPLLNSENSNLDLQENAIQIIGEEDGVFDDSDYILFYAIGMDKWSEENMTHNNLYADKAYYYITTGGDRGKRIETKIQPTGSPHLIFDKYDFYTYHEVDKYNVGEFGRRWFGEELHLKPSYTFDFRVPNIVLGDNVIVEFSSVAISSKPSTINVTVNGINQRAVNFLGISDLNTVKGQEGTFESNYKENASNTISVTLSYNNNGVPSAKSYLDFLTVRAKSNLIGYGKQFGFRVNRIENNPLIGQYNLKNIGTVTEIWDVTTVNSVSKINKGPENDFSFLSPIDSKVHEYWLVDPNDYYDPKVDESVNVFNQDLKGTLFLDENNQVKPLDYLIVTPKILKSQADRLADFHRNYSKLNVKVVTLDAIYNEFSTGKQDIGAIRNLVRYLYETAPNGKKISYLCLFGDASFDYKDRIKNNTNLVPNLQSLGSFTLADSFVSDEFFGMLDPAEGRMTGVEGCDIAVGRILAKDILQAQQMVDKIIQYHDKKSLGKWRNNLVFLSDDVDKDSDATLQVNLNNMADTILYNRPSFNAKKIFTDAYEQIITSGGQKYPKAKEAFLNSFSQGALAMVYIGHGGESGLASERLFELADIKNLTNPYKFPLFMTVTCEFTRYDNPLRDTGGELAFQNPYGGPVALISTSRLIYQFIGEQYNLLIAPYLFGYSDKGKVSIAEAVRLAKQESLNIGNHVISFIGDPAMKLAIPEPKVVMTHINDQPIADYTGSLSALSKIKISGEIQDDKGQLKNDFNGELFVSIFDKFIDKTTLANDGVLPKMSFKALGETIFRGNANVKEGKFQFTFVVPKDIAIPIGNGKMSFYVAEDTKNQDKGGYDLNLKIGGVNQNAPEDKTPPKMQLYINDKTFVAGSVVNQKPILIVELQDENGINTAGGIGHDIVAYLDGDETKPIILNDFYNSAKDDYTKGIVNYQFSKLSSGIHTLTVKAWDVYNNMVSSDLKFVVIDDSELVLTNVLNYPNPFVNYTEFWFTHNRPFEPLEIQIQVMTITGRIVWTKNQTVSTTGFLSRDLVWDGRDDFGDKIGKGVYLYKLSVKSILSNKKAEKIEKLVIL
ncbi:type IX secretion system sortase PorU [Flavobacterium columnare]|uniref:Type IX secretion system sortase PorU n=1 Tax=Flavobacterium columnare TaxID=996 RepID=A0A437U7X7_9FLAO|nr:type IX secretion system sortase PorU [Flavobacterium columnare]RVU89705.1 type IX secretion system sortase PorU [Flavobacterium columnare]